MFMKNVSARLHHLGPVSLAPGQHADVPDAYAKAANPNDVKPCDKNGELVEPTASKPAAKPQLTAAEKAAAAKKASEIATAQSKLATAKAGGDQAAIDAAQAELDALTAE